MQNVFNKATLYVPESVINDYKSDSWWSKFNSIMDLTVVGIDNLSDCAKSTSGKYIKNGRIVIIKEGNTYSVTGVKQ